jgi:hypothetical protein
MWLIQAFLLDPAFLVEYVWTEAEETIDDLKISFFARQVRELDISPFKR